MLNSVVLARWQGGGSLELAVRQLETPLQIKFRKKTARMLNSKRNSEEVVPPTTYHYHLDHRPATIGAYSKKPDPPASPSRHERERRGSEPQIAGDGVWCFVKRKQSARGYAQLRARPGTTRHN